MQTRCLTILLSSLLILWQPCLGWTESGCGSMPARGPQGPAGLQGTIGPAGPVGPTGAYGLGNTLSLTLQNTQEVVNQQTVLFDGIEENQGAISYDPSTGVITLINPGFYRVQFGISASTSNDQFGLRLDGAGGPISGSAIDSYASAMQGVALLFETTAPATTLEVINNSGGNVTLTTTNISSCTAYLVIRQIK